jgi:hypothetical protein
MFKEVVSLAIIMGFIINIVYVDHPNSASYTAAFVLSLIILSPFVLWLKWGTIVKPRRQLCNVRDDVESLPLVPQPPVLEAVAEQDLGGAKESERLLTEVVGVGFEPVLSNVLAQNVDVGKGLVGPKTDVASSAVD